MNGIASPFPLIQVSSPDARRRGRMMGEAAKDRIAESVDAYQETFDRYTGLGWDRVTDLALEFAPAIEAYSKPILEEIEGLAEGAGVSLGDLLALNARSEIMFGLSVTPPPECTTFYAGPTATADGHVLLGQNWDWRPRAIESTTLFEVDQGPEAPAFMMLPEAGLVGKTGFNDRGIGVTLNALVSDLDKGERAVPIHVIMREILNAETIEQAFGAIVRSRRGASANYTIACAGGVGLAAEVGPGGVESVQIMHPTDDVLGHSNHFACRNDFGDVGIGRWPDSPRRIETMRRFLAARVGELTPDSIKEVLRDSEGHPNAICRFPDPDEHPVDQIATVASVIMDLTTREVELAAGAPSISDYSLISPAFSSGALVAPSRDC